MQSKNIVTELLNFFFQAEDGIRDLVRSRGLGDVYKRQAHTQGLRAGGDVAYQDGCRRAGNALHVVVLGQPAVSYTHLTLPTIYSV